jgi:stage II sporulation protein D
MQGGRLAALQCSVQRVGRALEICYSCEQFRDIAFFLPGRDAMEHFRQGSRTPFFRTSMLFSLFAIALMVGCTLVPSGCSQSSNHPVPVRGTPIVRVLILNNQTNVQLSATQQPTVQVGNGASQTLGLSGGGAVPVTLTASGWQIGSTSVGMGELTIIPASIGSVAVAGHSFRGQYRFLPKNNGKFDVINDVDVDGYLMGVLAEEMLKNWHEEAYRAQAIVARTYALYEAGAASAGAKYDLFSDTHSQMYTGINGETARSRSAVEATRGMVAASGPPGQERIFKAYYSSCCGGVSQTASEAFDEPNFEPLVDRDVGKRCAASPKFTWPTLVVAKSEITRRLRVWGASANAPEKDIDEVARVEIGTSNPFGRPSSFHITDVRGMRYRLCSEDFRHAMNTDTGAAPKLPSTFCLPVNDGPNIRFTEGHGLGHGVGMCQWCAEEQAIAGASHEQIVLDAFPKAIIVKAY